ncbi:MULTISPECIES: hypothetical protein [unclassified Streptomyces]|uniref:Uncharacterized protein n=1 Tax=Streptomyces sp. NBC_00060 TaxID=2975636 RepID=A0AAU2GU27_9ACTN
MELGAAARRARRDRSVQVGVGVDGRLDRSGKLVAEFLVDQVEAGDRGEERPRVEQTVAARALVGGGAGDGELDARGPQLGRMFAQQPVALRNCGG